LRRDRGGVTAFQLKRELFNTLFNRLITVIRNTLVATPARLGILFPRESYHVFGPLLIQVGGHAQAWRSAYAELGGFEIDSAKIHTARAILCPRGTQCTSRWEPGCQFLDTSG
jgi:hypothetical protein